MPRPAIVAAFCYAAFGFGYIIPATFLPALAKGYIDNPAMFGLVWPVFGTAAALSTFASGWLGRGLANLAAVIDPSVFVIGGGVSEAGDLLILPARQTFGETIYDVAETQIAEQGLPSKAIGRWFPYVASLFLFILVVNLIGFIPLPLTGETWHGIPVFGIYAATSSLSVTLALAALTFVFTHFEGIRWNGPTRCSQ